MKRQSVNLRTIARQAMSHYGFRASFPKFVLKEVKQTKEQLTAKANQKNVVDLRTLLWSSIDNVDSQDLDQLEYCERRPNREILVKVAISDVDAFVKKGSHTDKHASYNGTSVYTGVEIFPMLPDRLSSNMSSLKEGEDRLAVVIEFIVKKDGSLRPKDVYRALVNNKAKLIYEEVGEWLQGEVKTPIMIKHISGLEQQIRLQNEAASRLRNFRAVNGALELETIEAKPLVVDDSVIDLVIQKKNLARLIIENFMIAANTTMVWFLERKGSPVIQRVVRTPERWAKIVELAASFQDDLPAEPDALALSKFIIRRRTADPLHFPDLSLTIVKLLGPGEYTFADPGKVSIGHFGLAIRDYTHATAPNRRYIDVVVQRLLKSILRNHERPYSKRELIEIAAWCTNRDQAAKKVERFMRKAAAADLLKDRLGMVFDAIVTGASFKGTYVRLLNPPAEGRVMRGEEGLTVGEKLQVKLINLNPQKGFIDFERVGYSTRLPRGVSKETRRQTYERRKKSDRRRKRRISRRQKNRY